MVAYCINSTVLSRVVVNAVWPGFLDGPGHTSGKILRWAVAASAIMATALAIAILVPFFSGAAQGRRRRQPLTAHRRRRLLGLALARQT